MKNPYRNGLIRALALFAVMLFAFLGLRGTPYEILWALSGMISVLALLATLHIGLLFFVYRRGAREFLEKNPGGGEFDFEAYVRSRKEEERKRGGK